MSKLLYEYETDLELPDEDEYSPYEIFIKKLNESKEMAFSGELTLKEFLELGFNNSKLLKRDNPDWEFRTGYRRTDKYKDMYELYSEELTKEMLNVKVVGANTTYKDLDGYTCLDIYCVDDKDYKLFDDVLEKQQQEDYELYQI